MSIEKQQAIGMVTNDIERHRRILERAENSFNEDLTSFMRAKISSSSRYLEIIKSMPDALLDDHSADTSKKDEMFAEMLEMLKEIRDYYSEDFVSNHRNCMDALVARAEEVTK
jgi:hypothetical protein